MSDAADLEAALGKQIEGEVRFDALTRRLYSTDASMYAIEPIGVVFPRSAADVAAVVQVAGQFGVPVLPRGAATSLAGQTVGHAVVVDFAKHLRDIIEVDREQATARVQPGVVQSQLNSRAGRDGLVFGPDTSTANRATLGGMIGNNSGGSHSVIYGMTIEHVRSLEVVLSDGTTATFGRADASEVARRALAPTLEGEIYRRIPALVEAHREVIATRYPPYWRRSGGYRLDRVPDDGSLDLAALLTGSEGTLAVVTEATVGLVAKPNATAIAVGHFTSTAAAIAATEDALSCAPAAVELLDATILDLARARRDLAAVAAVLDGEPAALLFVSFNGDTLAEASDGVERIAALWERHGHGYATLRARTAAEQAPLLKVRSSALGLLMASSTGGRRPIAFVEDTAVDPARLEEYAGRFRQALERRGVRAGFYGHCSVGCLHVRPFLDLRVEKDVETMHAIAEEVLELAAEFGGSNSSEHGDGLARSEFNRRIYGDELYEAMRELKGIFDPHNRMNPGKIVDGPAMTENLRDPAIPEPIALQTRRAFPEGSMFAAADRCMRIGACRKAGEATMCPSYMATFDEEHSTRGRANALVQALSSADPAAALGDERLHDALDLCLECKACKAECPLSVDMAALKSEFLSHYHDLHGVPLRSKAIASIRTFNRIGSMAAPLANAVARSSPARSLLERHLGIDRRRTLPSVAAESLPRWWKRRARRGGSGRQPHRGKVVLFADTFTAYGEPAIGRAAIELLEMAGYEVALESSLCCGRPQISKGLLDSAREKATALVARLGPLAAEGVTVLGWEPSCVSAMVDDFPALLPADPLAKALSENVRLVDEVLLEAVRSGALALDEDAALAGKRILFHGHCHQKAVLGVESSVALLALVPGAEVVELDAGCCGMAGSFGFEAEHFDLSMSIGGARLFPAVAAEPPSTVVVATGVSCRQQIAQGTGRHALHPVELLRAVIR